MIYRYEYYPNPNCVAIHTNIRIVEDGGYLSHLSSNMTGSDKELYDLMNSTEGNEGGILQGVTITPYKITLYVGPCFERDQVLDDGWNRLKAWLIMRGKVAQDEVFEQKSTLRSDIEYHRCQQCKKEQEEMYREL